VLDLPNGVTLSGLAAGLLALGLAVQQRFGAALALALLAILIDQIDGRLALAQPARSPAMRAFGAHLDCYADFVSKGIFPALMLLVVGGFGAVFWAVAVLQVSTIAVRYSYEFVPDAPPRGLSPDFSVVTFALLYALAAPPLGDRYPAVLAGAMVVLAALNLAPLRVPKLSGLGLGAFVAVVLGLMALLVGGS
jgi:CDP-diacylglycerol--serine O-phosphatidyltransferase